MKSKNPLYFERYGDKKNSALVLLHSGGMAGIEWKPQIATLSKHFDLFVPDALGHGKSLVEVDEKLSIASMSKAVISMLLNEGIEKAHICGSSMGGAMALWIAIHQPRLLDKLVIYRMGYCKNTETHEQTQMMADPAYWKQYGLHNWLSKIHFPQGDEHSWEEVIANVSRVLDPIDSDHNHELLDLANIKAETLLIAGDRDPLVPVSILLEMQKAIANSALWIMPNASHVTASNTWRANSFSEELIRFLR